MDSSIPSTLTPPDLTRRLIKLPRTMTLAISAVCNLRCKYCYHFTGPGDVGQQLPAEEWLRFIEEMGRYQIVKVILAGAEPFARKDLLTLLQALVENNMRFAILTNGTLVTAEHANFIRRTNRCDYVQVSIDGADAATHDLMRGNGSFERAVRGLRLLQEAGVNVVVRVTIHKANVRKLEQITRFLLEDLKLHHFSTDSANCVGACRNTSGDVLLSVDEFSMAMEALTRLDKTYPGRIQGLSGPLACARIWKWMLEAHEQGEPEQEGGYLKSCNGVWRSLDVREDGVLVPCTQLSHIALGRINKDDLKEVWQNNPVLRQLRNRQAIPLSGFEYCRDCRFVASCLGGCPASSFNQMGEENSPDPDICLQRFLANGGRLPF